MTTNNFNGFGFVDDDEAFEAYVAWAEQQDDLPDDENEAMALWEAHVAAGAQS